MVKTHHTPPRFLQEKLSPKRISFVKKHIATFIEKLKKKNKGELPSNPQLLCQYIDYLGKLDSQFKGIHHSCIVTTYDGIYQIYDPLRRAAERFIEEKPSPSKPPTPARMTRAKAEATPASKDPAQIQDQEAVKIEANNDYAVKGDRAEKDMAYRKNVDDDAELTASLEPDSSEREDEQEEAEPPVQKDIGGPWWQKEKKLFCGLLDSFDPSEFRELTIKVTRDEQQTCQIIIEHMRAQH